MIVSDTILNNLFPHNGDPLHVWINSKGLVAAITQYYNTNYETISEELTNGHIQLPRRRDSGIDIYYPLLSEQNKTILPLTTFHSMLLKGTQDYLTGSSIQIKKDPDTQKSYSIEAINVRLFTLYKIAYFPALYGFNASVYSIQNNNRLILLVKDSLPFYQPTDPGKTGKWIKDNMYAYETTIPENAGLNIFETMQEDLSRYFKYTVKIEKRKTKCMVLVRTSSEDKLKTKDSNARPSIISLGKKGLRIQNMPLKESLLKMIVYANDRLPEPILDETGYKSNIDITLNVSLRDIPSLRKSLKIFGLDLIEKETETDFLVIQDRKTN